MRDVTGKIVSPGLIDLHTHVYWGGTSLGVEAELLARTGGVTTFVDAGSAGPGNFHGFRKHVIEPSPVRILPYLNVAFPGIFAFSKTVMVGENADMRLIDAREAVRVAREHKDLVLGIKVRVGRSASGDSGVKPLDIALDVAEELGLPVMAHLDAPPPSRREVVDRLRPGDILTHCFRPFPNAPVRPDGKVRDEILAARARGVIFDIGHGGGSFGFGTTRGMLAAGFLPDVISSDVHVISIEGPAFDLLTTMSKFLCLGVDLANRDQARDRERRRRPQAARPRHPEGRQRRRGHGDRAGERQVRLCRFDRRAHDGRQAAALGRRGAGGPLVASGVTDEPDEPKEFELSRLPRPGGRRRLHGLRQQSGDRRLPEGAGGGRACRPAACRDAARDAAQGAGRCAPPRAQRQARGARIHRIRHLASGKEFWERTGNFFWPASLKTYWSGTGIALPPLSDATLPTRPIARPRGNLGAGCLLQGAASR